MPRPRAVRRAAGGTALLLALSAPATASAATDEGRWYYDMRRTDVAGDVEVRTQVLQVRLGQLVTPFDDTDRLKGQIQLLRENQSGGVWPDIPSVEAFAASYRKALSDAEAYLEVLRTAIDACRQALSDSPFSLEQQDAAIEEQFRLLAERLDATPPQSAAGPGAASAVPGSVF